MAGLAGIDLLGRGIKAGAKALDYEIPKNIEPFLTPVSSAKDFLSSKIETALNLPKDSVAFATDPKGFLGNLAKDVAKEKIVESMGERREIPVEDRSFSSSGGGGSQPYTDDELTSGRAAYKRGGKVKNTASRRGDGIAQRGKTRGRYL
jgi:hypothetical protein